MNVPTPDGFELSLLRRDRSGSWSTFPIAQKRDAMTRPVVLIDEENRELYVVATCTNPASIRMKRTGLDAPHFDMGVGEALIESATDPEVNNATSTKQNLDSTCGLLVLASDDVTLNYMHNFLELRSTEPPSAEIHAAIEYTELGVRRGDLTQTFERDGVAEVLTERGWGRGYAHGLTHVWAFPMGDAPGMAVRVRASCEGEETLVFWYFDARTWRWSKMFEMSGGGEEDADASFELPSRMRLYRRHLLVAVTDSRWLRDREADSISVDHLAVLVKNAPSGRTSTTSTPPGDSALTTEELRMSLELLGRLKSAQYVESDVSDLARDAGLQGPVAASGEFDLVQNQPNPFRNTTGLQFQIPRAERVVLRVFNSLGQHVRTLVDGEVGAGRHDVRWDGRDSAGRAVAAGVYYYRIDTDSFSRVRKMSLLR
jgi:hypothetical protein